MNTIDAFSPLNASAGKTAASANDAASADRFLKLLVTQMQNQDPLNPMDNAQITSQMAQINTVSGIEKLNTTVDGLNRQFVQLQALQGASLVGRVVTVPGDELTFYEGAGVGSYELAGTADRVKVEVLSPAGRVVDTVNVGAHGAGRHSFEWTPQGELAAADKAGYRFRVVAATGTINVTGTPLMHDLVKSVSMLGDQLSLETSRSGTLPYSAIKSVN